jgi:hypothetical protein
VHSVVNRSRMTVQTECPKERIRLHVYGGQPKKKWKEDHSGPAQERQALKGRYRFDRQCGLLWSSLYHVLRLCRWRWKCHRVSHFEEARFGYRANYQRQCFQKRRHVNIWVGRWSERWGWTQEGTNKKRLKLRLIQTNPFEKLFSKVRVNRFFWKTSYKFVIIYKKKKKKKKFKTPFFFYLFIFVLSTIKVISSFQNASV